MHPIMFRIPMPGWDLPVFGVVDSIPIYSYGVMLGLSLVVGWYLTLGLAERDGLPRETMANNYVITAIVAVVASRLLYILTNLDEFESFGDIVSMRRGGLVAYGGFIGGFIGSWAYLKQKRIRLLPWADVAVPSLASGLAVTRIGCYLFGCDYGKPLSESAPQWLKTIGSFPQWPEGTLSQGSGAPAWVHHTKPIADGGYDLSMQATHSLPVHPTQIYESVLGVALLALLLLARKRQRFRGQIFLLFTFAYGVARFLLELLRDDPERGVIPPAMAEQVLVPLCLLLFAAGYVFSLSRMIESDTWRRVSQLLAFVPAVVMYFALKPESFAISPAVELSTSQFIGLASGLAACGFFFMFDKAALAHPQTAMSLGWLGDEGADDDDEDQPAKKRASKDEEDEDEDAEDKPKPRKTRARRRKRRPAEGDDGAEPKKTKRRRKKKKPKEQPPKESSDGSESSD